MARRINKKFVGILGLSALLVGGGIYGAQRLLIHEYPDKYIEAGRQAMQDKQWQIAADDFNIAAKLDPTNDKTQLMLAAAYHEIVKTDSTALKQEVSAYQRALEINPNSLPALNKLIDLFQQIVSGQPTGENYNILKGFADSAKKLQPGNLQAAELPDQLIIQEWVTGLAIDQKAADEAVAEIEKFIPQDPANAELPYAAAKAYIQEAKDANKGDNNTQTQEATDDFAKAVATFDAALKSPGQDSNAMLHFRFAAILGELASNDQSVPREKYLARRQAESDRARALVKPTDPEYLPINGYAADLLIQQGDFQGAANIYRSLPKSPIVNLALAQVLANVPNGRVEAERILDDTLATLPYDPTTMDLVRFRVMVELTRDRVTDLGNTTDPVQRQNLSQTIQNNISILRERRGNSNATEIALLDAQYNMAIHQDFQAIEELTKLISADSNAGKDYNVLKFLALASENANQPGQAIAYLTQAVNRYPDQVESRKRLVSLLLQNSPNEAAAQLQMLEKQIPNDPDLPLFELQYMYSSSAAPSDIRKKFDSLPESTTPQLLAKAHAARVLKYWDDAVRLLSQRVADDPHDVNSYFNLISVYQLTGRHDAALAEAQRAAAANPESSDLALVVKELQGVSVPSINLTEEQRIREALKNDPFHLETALAAMEDRNGNYLQEETHLKAALAANPNQPSPQVWDALFKVYLKLKKYDQAASYIDLLTQANYDQVGGDSYRFLLAHAKNDVSRASDIAKKLTAEKPEFVDGWLYLGQVLQDTGDCDQAITQYNIVLDRQGNNVDAYRGLVECCYAVNKPDDAWRWIQQGVSRVPGDPTLTSLEIAHVLNYGNPSDAIALIQDQIRKTPGDPRLYTHLGEIYIRVARVLEENKDHDKAVTILGKAHDILTQSLAKWPDEAGLYIAIEELDLTVSHPDDAEAVLKQWVKRDAWKSQPDPYRALADFYESQKKPDQANEQMRIAYANSGNNVDYEIELATMLVRNGKTDEALQLLAQNNPDNAAVQRTVIELLLKVGKFDEAQKQLATYLSGTPANREELLTLWAEMLSDHRDYDACIDKANQVLAINPRNLAAMLARGQALLLKTPSDPKAAYTDLFAIEQVDPANGQVHLCLAQIDLLLGHSDDAALELNSVLRIDPTNKGARMTLVGIYSDPAHPMLAEAIHTLTSVDRTAQYAKDPDIFETEAGLYARQNDLPDAIDRSARALSLKPNDPTILQMHLQLQIQTSQFQPLLALTDSLPDALKNTWWVALNRGLAFNGINDKPHAVAEVTRAMSIASAAGDVASTDTIAIAIGGHIDPDTAITVLTPYAQAVPQKLTLVVLQHQKNDDAAAVATLEPLLDALPSMTHDDQVQVLTIAAEQYQLMSTPDAARKSLDAYQKLLALQPDNWMALNNVACLLADNFTPTRAAEGLQYIQKAVDQMTAQGKENLSLLDTQGWLLILTGSPDKGVDALSKVVEAEPSPSALYHVAEGYMGMSSPDEAAFMANRGLKLLSQSAQPVTNDKLKAKLQDVLTRAAEMQKTKPQANVPQ
jgi:predicted Zn-dependent protease